jgi:DNA-binding GntR family transcriptional regulator
MLEASGNDTLIALSSSIAAAINQTASNNTIAAHRDLYDAIVATNAPRAERTMIEAIRLAANDAAILLDEKPAP